MRSTPQPHRIDRRFAPPEMPGAALEKARRRLDGHLHRLSERIERCDIRLKAIEFKLNVIWAVTVLLLAMAMGMVVNAAMKN